MTIGGDLVTGRLVPCLALLVALAACPEPAIVDPAPPGITLRIDRGNTSDANQRADRYCQSYGKRAHLGSIQPGAGSESIATYACE
jgi:hypothetical protein